MFNGSYFQEKVIRIAASITVLSLFNHLLHLTISLGFSMVFLNHCLISLEYSNSS